MAELSPPSSSVEAHEPELPRPKVCSDQALRLISSEVDIVSPGPSGETPPTPPATTRASTAISGAAETDNEDDEETTVGVPVLVVDEPTTEQAPAPERIPPPLSQAPPIHTVDVTNIDITTTPATPEEGSMPAFKTSPKRDTPERSTKPRPPPVPFARPLSEFPPTPSTLSRVQNEDGLLSPGLTISALPPSPPLTRRGTNSTRTTSSSRYGPRTVAVLERSSTSSDRTVTRPGTSSSSASIKDASVKDVSKLGRRLGKQPADYLVPNGSLSKTISINFHPLQEPHTLKNSPGTDGPVASIFRNLNILIDSYLAILSNGGSVAVANGYHSEARKLLEQVGGLFTRDLGVDGVGWPDILEYIRGGRDRPCLCVLPVKGLLSRRNIEASILSGTGVDDETVSNLYPPSQFITKELAESVVAGVKRKTGKVEDWLEEVEKVLRRAVPPPSSPTSISPVSEDGEMDEHGEIVVQIIEGILNHSQIAIFRSYLKDTRFLASTKLALIRLYPQHTPAAITAPIVALYLLLHDELHPLLEAVSTLSDAEIELINSGRLDSFLDGSSNAIPRDDEEELATISHLDRNLWRVLEGLEDEIEELHSRALVIRRALKERKDGIAKKFKKRSMQAIVEGEVPIPLQLLGEALEDENNQLLAPVEEWEGGQSILLGPDDSASNVTFNRRRRAERLAEKEKMAEGERKKKLKERERERGAKEPRDEKEIKDMKKEREERREREEKKEREREREGRDGKEERREKRREKKETEEDAEGEGTVVGSGKSVHKKREKKDRRDKTDCDVEGCDECGSSVKRPRSRKKDGEESEKLEEIKEGKELKHAHRSHKDSKEPEKIKEEKKEKEPKDKKGGLLNSIERWVDKKITTDKPSKEDKKEKEKDKAAIGKAAELREKERPATSHSHRDTHGHRERDYREGYRENHKEVSG